TFDPHPEKKPQLCENAMNRADRAVCRENTFDDNENVSMDMFKIIIGHNCIGFKPCTVRRCGEGYSRDAICNCDYNCQHYMECCPDFKKVCTVEFSCKGRCFESFTRGRACDCDSECKKYGKCCFDYDSFCEKVHSPASPPPSKSASPPPGASQTIKSTTKPSPKSSSKKTKKNILFLKIKSLPPPLPLQLFGKSSFPKIQLLNRELKKKPKVKDNKKKRTPKKKPTPEPPVIDEAGNGPDNGDFKLTPTPDIPTTQRNKVTTTPKIKIVKPILSKPSIPPNSDTTKETPLTANKETIDETKETSTTNKQTSTTAKERTTSAKETQNAEKTSTKDFAPTSEEPTPSSPNTPAPTTSEASTSTTTMEPPTTPKGPAESSPEFPVEPTPKTLEKSPKEPAVPTTKAPKVTKPEMTTTAKDKATEKDTTDTMASSKITLKATTLAPKVMTATKKTTEETTSKPEPTTAIPKGTATNSQVTTPKPQKPTKAPKKLTCTKKPKTPRVRKPKTTPTPPKMTSANPTSLAEAKLQTTTSPNQTPNSEIIEVSLKNEDADATEGEKPHMIPRPPVLTPIVIPATDFIGRGPSQGIGINPMFSDETNLCNGRPVDGLTALRNGTLVAFRGHYFWMLNAFSPPSPPRRITEVWGIPSPIDTVFTRCNCEGKTFFFKDSQYWRFTNDIKDAGYPKLIPKGFGGLNGKIVAALSIAKYKNRPESVYFFKRGGSIQQYTYKQEPTQKCTRRKLAINYSVYGETTQVRRRRFERAIETSQTHTIRIHYSPIRVTYQDKGFLHNEVKVSTLWRGLPNVVTSAVSLPNIRKPDGYDYYAFSKDQYYNIDVTTRTARAITTRSGRTLSNVWYNCP
ncbi:hypothetical protein E2I00_014645, partial [Balaenoptera physalus]